MATLSPAVPSTRHLLSLPRDAAVKLTVSSDPSSHILGKNDGLGLFRNSVSGRNYPSITSVVTLLSGSQQAIRFCSILFKNSYNLVSSF